MLEKNKYEILYSQAEKLIVLLNDIEQAEDGNMTLDEHRRLVAIKLKAIDRAIRRFNMVCTNRCKNITGGRDYA